MIKFSISSVLVLTFWFAAAIASISIVGSSSQSEQYMAVVRLITASFSLAVIGFAFYCLFSAVFGSKDSRPFWSGSAVVSWFLILVEPNLNLGLTVICLMLADFLTKGSESNSVFGNVGWMVGSTKLAVAEILRNAWVPLVGIIGGLLAQAIANEASKASDLEV